VSVAIVDNNIAGMLLAYRLPPPHRKEPLDAYPEFIRPLIELEQCVPDTFYINMLASYPDYRGQGVASKLMDYAAVLASQSDCSTLSLEVFEENENAVRLYRRLGYSVLDQRDVIPHPCHTHRGKVLLFTKLIS
jgi:ribosomal protein S18 acetylase RimI-like enzyme